MFRKLSGPIVILISSTLVLALNLSKAPLTIYQQIILLLMIILIYLISPISFAKKILKFLSPTQLYYSILFLSTLLTQLLIISTGAFFSPFLILIHLYTLTLGFLVNLGSSFSFLTFSLINLGFYSYINSAQLNLLREDPGTLLLYLLSFIVVIPLAQVISKKYHFKDELAKLLTKQIRLNESILENLSELVFITDPKSQIISVNEAVKKTLNLTDSELVGKPLLEVLNLKDAQNLPTTFESLSVESVASESISKIVSDLYLITKKHPAPIKINLQIRPITDKGSITEQLSFIINQSGGGTVEMLQHKDLEQAREKYQSQTEVLVKVLLEKRLFHEALQTQLSIETFKDILVAQELEDHPVKTKIKLIDLAELASKVVVANSNLAKFLNVSLSFKLPDSEVKEYFALKLRRSNLDPNNLPIPDFAAPLDSYWTNILINELTKLALLLSYKADKHEVFLIPERSGSKLTVKIVLSNPGLLKEEIQQLFIKYYDKLGYKTNLSLGSGLEGSIAKDISTVLGVPIRVSTNPSNLEIAIEFDKSAK